jgi:hypothetical protein
LRLILRIREQPGNGLADVWLIQRDGDTDSGLLHGIMYTDRADALAAALRGGAGLIIEAEKGWVPSAGPPEEVIARQRDLFDASRPPG